MDLPLLDKYKLLEFKSVHDDGMLFPLDLSLAIEKGVCPLCLNRLYLMWGKPFYWCKSRKHKQRFIISKDKCRFVNHSF